MSNKKIGLDDLAKGTRAAKRYLAHREWKKNRKELVAEHNRKFELSRKP